jgi:hypothetical protein
MTLDGSELTAVLRHAAPGLVPAGVSNPVVHLEGGVVRVTARVVRHVLPTLAQLGSILDMLPDTVDVELLGRFDRDDTGALVFRVEHARAQGVRLPRALVGSVVAALPGGMARGSRRSGTADEDDGVPALRLPLPAGIGVVRVLDDVLILERPEPILDRAVDGSGSP